MKIAHHITIVALGIATLTVFNSAFALGDEYNNAVKLYKDIGSFLKQKKFSEAYELIKQNENVTGKWCNSYDGSGECDGAELRSPVPVYKQKIENAENCDRAIKSVPLVKSKEDASQARENLENFCKERDLGFDVDVEEVKSEIPFMPFSDTKIAQTLAEAQNRCRTQRKWTFNKYKTAPKAQRQLIVHGDTISGGQFNRFDQCEESRLNTPDNLRPMSGDRCKPKYFGKAEKVDVIKAEAMIFEESLGQNTKKEFYFSSEEACNDIISKLHTSKHEFEREVSIHPLGSNEKNRFIKACLKTAIKICTPPSAEIENVVLEK
jgi:hypothetical protein